MKTEPEEITPLPAKKYMISKKVDSFLIDIYSVYRFIARFFREAFKGRSERKEILTQCYEVGYRSLPLITLTGFYYRYCVYKTIAPVAGYFRRKFMAAIFNFHCYHTSTGTACYCIDYSG